MTDVPEGPKGFFSKKLFGVQVLYWAAILVLVLAYFAWKMRTADSAPAADAETDPALAPENMDDSAGIYDGFQAQATPTYDATKDVTTTVDTNDAWAKRVVEWSAQTGLAGAGEAQLAIQKYLNGDQLSFDEGRIRDAAIAHFGAPPEPITVGGTDPEGAKRQGTPPTFHTVKGVNDNTYTKLVNLYWGSASNDRIDLIQNANHSLGKSGPFPVGTRVMVPAYHAPKYYRSTKKVNTLKEIAAKNSTSVTALRILNDGIKDTLKSGTKVRVA